MATGREIGGATAGLGTATARLAITNVGSATGITSPSYDLPALTNSNAPFASDFVTLANGANTITVPPNAAAVLLLPPNANANAWTLKGVSGDTGVPMNPNGWAFVPFASSVTTFVITTVGGITGFTLLWF